MTDSNPVKQPLPTNFVSRPATDEEFAEARLEEYPAMVGSIMYAAGITRPYIAYAAGLLARPQASGARLTYMPRDTYSGISEVPPTYASPSMPLLVNVWPSATQMLTGEDASTHADPPPAIYSEPSAGLSLGSHADNRRRRSLRPKQNTWRQPMPPVKLCGCSFSSKISTILRKVHSRS